MRISEQRRNSHLKQRNEFRSNDAFFGAKNFDFSKFMVCPHGQGGKRSIFHDFVERLLWAAPNQDPNLD